MSRTSVFRPLPTVLAVVVALSIPAVSSQVLTPENASLLRESSRFDAGVSYFHPLFLATDLLALAGDRTTTLWDLAADGAPLEPRSLRLDSALAVSSDRSLLAIYSASRALEVWSCEPIEKVSELVILEQTRYPRAAFSRDLALVAVTNRWNEIDLWNLETEELVNTLSGHRSNLFDLAFSPDGSLLASGGGISGGSTEADSFIGVWDVPTGELIAELPTADIGDNHSMLFTRDGGRLISGGNHRMIAWDTVTWERVYDSGPSYPGNSGIGLSPDGRLLAITTYSNRIRLMNVDTLRVVRNLYLDIRPMDVDFSPDGTKLVAACTDGTLRTWEVRD